jgi:hypothetical protein
MPRKPLRIKLSGCIEPPRILRRLLRLRMEPT